MTYAEAVKIMKNEILCVKTANTCGRDCKNCPLVLPDTDLLDAYALAIGALMFMEDIDDDRK